MPYPYNTTHTNLCVGTCAESCTQSRQIQACSSLVSWCPNGKVKSYVQTSSSKRLHSSLLQLASRQYTVRHDSNGSLLHLNKEAFYCIASSSLVDYRKRYSTPLKHKWKARHLSKVKERLANNIARRWAETTNYALREGGSPPPPPKYISIDILFAVASPRISLFR